MPKLLELVQPAKGKDPVPEVVEILERLLVEAKAGEIWEVAVCCVTHGGGAYREHSCPEEPVWASMLIGEMFCLSQELSRPWDDE